MKSLKEYINEGLLDRVKNKEVNHEILIEEFLKENYEIRGSYTIKSTNKGFIVDVKGDVEVTNKSITALTNGLFEFGEVSRHFNCTNCESLKTLEGAPEEVWYFKCSNCNSLINLKGAPKEVGWSFECYSCKSLKSLEGAPKKVDRNFYCTGCKLLKSLEGAPKEVDAIYCNDCGVQFTEEDVKKHTNIKEKIFMEL